MTVTTTNITIISILISIISATATQKLSVEYINARFPEGISYSATYYDGDDTIYFFGGLRNGVIRPDIYKFSITSETLQRHGNIDPYAHAVCALPHTDGSLFYFGGGMWNGNVTEERAVLQYDFSRNSSSRTAILPYRVRHCGCVKYDEDTNIAFIFGGNGNQDGVLRYDMEDHSYKNITNLPTHFYRITAFRFGSAAYIIGASRVYKYDLNDYVVTIGPTFSEAVSDLTSVTDGKYGFVFGGFRNASSESSFNGVYRFDPTTLETVLLQIENFPGDENYTFTAAPNSVYIKKLNRIYLFGGTSYNKSDSTSTYHDDIWYIDLSSDATAVTGKTTTPRPEPTTRASVITTSTTTTTTSTSTPSTISQDTTTFRTTTSKRTTAVITTPTVITSTPNHSTCAGMGNPTPFVAAFIGVWFNIQDWMEII